MCPQLANYWRSEEFEGLECLSATTSEHRYPRHSHSTFVLEIVESGTNGVYCNGRTHIAPEGSIIVINPEEVHTGYPVGPNLLAYRSMYPNSSVLSKLNG